MITAWPEPLVVEAGRETDMDRIVVGVDTSAVAAAALRWALQLATSTGSEVVAVSAVDDERAEIASELHARSLEEGEAVATRTPDVSVELRPSPKTVVRAGDPRDVLLSVAEIDDADLLVLGRTGEGGGPGFLHLGSVVEYAAHHSPVPLAVIPPGWSEAVERIVIGLDGSKESFSALSWVVDVAPALGASVMAVQVQEPYIEWTAPPSAQNWRRDVERNLEEWTAPLREVDVPVSVLAQRDLHPADGLLGVTSAQRADLLVVGARGLGGFAGLRAGGVALKVLHKASVPLVMVPRA